MIEVLWEVGAFGVSGASIPTMVHNAHGSEGLACRMSRGAQGLLLWVFVAWVCRLVLQVFGEVGSFPATGSIVGVKVVLWRALELLESPYQKQQKGALDITCSSMPY